jgi:C1A family cysteine protease
MSKILIILALLSLVISLTSCNRELYEEMKAKATFQVMDYEEHQKLFRGRTYEDFSVWKGENHLFSKEALELLKEEKSKTFLESDELKIKAIVPTEFDWRKAKPECLTPIKDQAYCGSCYSFSVTAALESRFCIASQGKVKVELSQQDIISCDDRNAKCKGDRLDNTWKFLENYGTCTLQCKPYVSANGSVADCWRSCKSNLIPYVKYKARAGSWRFISNIDQIKLEIYTNGPISAGMATYEDFQFYKSGVYKHVSGRQTDHHAVVILGWGKDAIWGSEYWILRNSWGPTWGENGYFKVLMKDYEVSQMCNASLPLI